MKKLFLASVAANVLDKILPLLPDKPNTLKLAFVPTAANLNEDKSWLLKDRDKLVELGFKVTDLDIEGQSEEDLKGKLTDIDVLFVSGGNTFYLLEKARESGFDTLAKDFISKGKVYIGSSAGSVIVCPTIGFVEGMDDPSVAPSLTSFAGFDEVDYLVMPHFRDDDYKDVIDKNISEWKRKGYEI